MTLGSTDRLQYWYERNGNPLFKSNAATGGSAHSELYGYDGLNRLITFQRGTLNTPGTAISSPTASQTWSLDAVGNWGTFSFGVGSVTTQVRSHDGQNKLTSFDNGSGATSVSYDDNGNQVADGTRVYGYDAWNRLVYVADAPYEDPENFGLLTTPPGDAYPYDALGRRVAVTYDVDAPVFPLVTTGYVNSVWGQRLLAGDTGEYGDALAGQTGQTNYVYTPARGRGVTGGYVNEFISATSFSYRTQSATWSPVDRVYFNQDANFNTTSTVRIGTGGYAGGTTVSRYEQSPYGAEAAVLTAGFGAGGADYSGGIRFQGGFEESGLIHFGAREYDPVQGRWKQQDPAGWPDGAGRYEMVAGAVLRFVDPSGRGIGTVPGQGWNNQKPVPPPPEDPGEAIVYVWSPGEDGKFDVGHVAIEIDGQYHTHYPTISHFPFSPADQDRKRVDDEGSKGPATKIYRVKLRFKTRALERLRRAEGLWWTLISQCSTEAYEILQAGGAGSIHSTLYLDVNQMDKYLGNNGQQIR